MKVRDLKHGTYHVIRLRPELMARFTKGADINRVLSYSSAWLKVAVCLDTDCKCGNIVEVVSHKGKKHTQESLREQLRGIE